MVQYFCRRCQRPNPNAVCESCKKSIPASSVCNVWETRSMPILQKENIFFVLRTMLFVIIAVFAIMLAVEFVYSSSMESISVFLTKSGVIPLIVKIYAIGAALGLITLLLQGDETVQVLIEPKGVLKRTWIRPTRLKCYARFLRYDKEAILLNADNIPFLLAHEEYLAYQDCRRFALYPRSQRVKLYRPYSFLFMCFKVPRQDWEEAAGMLSNKLKKVAQ